MKVRQVLALVFLAFLQAEGATGQSFSCPIGREPACLDYGDRVVDQSAACFDTYQCNYEGFTCKSHLTDCASNYDSLQNEYNALVDKHNELIRDFNSIRDASLKMDETLRDMQDCVYQARTAEDARACAE
jgi:hypothetical protein